LVSAAALLLAAGVATSASAAVYTGFVTSSDGTLKDGDGQIVLGSPYTGSPGVDIAGNNWGYTGDDDGNRAIRVIIKLTLPTIPSGESFSSAAFKYYTEGASTAPNIGLVTFEPTSSTVVNSDFFDTTHASTMGTLIPAGGPAAAFTFTSAAFNTAVADAYGRGLSFIALRLQSEGWSSGANSLYTNGDGINDRRQIGMSELLALGADRLGQIPKLEVTTAVPEPTGLAVLGLSSLCMLRRRVKA